MLAPNTLIHNRYLIVRLIGQGGMGAVYEAVDERLDSRVALKQTLVGGLLKADRAFEREAKLLASLRHPALPKVIDYFDDPAGQFLVMEFIPGDNLADLMIERGAPFTVNEVLPWAEQVLRVLEYLHRQQPPILHRDIKPQNIKLTADGDIVLLDFGLARGSVALGSQLTSGSSVFGYSEQYSPPEQIYGGETDQRSDLYALGATMHHLLTELLPASASLRTTAILRHHPDPLSPAYDLNPQVPAAIGAVLLQSLALNPDERPASASAMRALLHSASSGPPSASVPTQVMPSLPPGANLPTRPGIPGSLPTSDSQPTVVQMPAQANASRPLVQPRNRRWMAWAIAVAVLAVLAGAAVVGAGRLGLLQSQSQATPAASFGAAATPTTTPGLAATAAPTSAPVAAASTATPTPTDAPTPTATPEPTAVPAGQRIAFVSVRDGNEEIYFMSADGSNQTRLTERPGGDYFPAWSPDGTRIAFVSERDGKRNGNAEIYVMNADGSNQTRLTEEIAASAALAWSPDSARIAFVGSAGGKTDIFAVNADGSGLANLTNSPEGDEAAPSWSPDGARVAFMSTRDGPSEIYVMNADGSNQTRLTEGIAANSALAWSPDGTKIAFQATAGGKAEVFAINPDGSDLANLSNSPQGDGAPVWSPDSTKIAFMSTREGAWDIYVMNADGSNPTRLTDDPQNDVIPIWSPDGTKIAFVSYRNSSPEIYVMNVDGSDQTPLTSDPKNNYAPAWS